MRFEKTEIWKRSKDLAVGVYKATRSLTDFGFRDQLTRSALSVSSNVAEGMERGSDKDLARFLTIARASCGEFKTQTIIGAEVGFIDENKARLWQNESEQLGKMLGAFIHSPSPTRGSKLEARS